MKKYTDTGKKDTRSGFGEGLYEAAAKNPDVVALTADLIGSVKMGKFAKDFPERFFQCGIAEANMIGTAAGLALTGKTAEGGKLSQSDRREYNRRARNFIDIKSSDIVKKDGKWMLVDSFGNPNIYVCVDADNDGFIKSGFPTIADGFTTTAIKEIVPNPSAGIRAKVIVFTLKKDSKRATADFSSEDIFTW